MGHLPAKARRTVPAVRETPVASPVRSFDAARISEAKRFTLYREVYANGADARLTGEGFRAQVRARRLETMVLFERRLRGVAHERLEPRVRQAGFDHFTLQLTVAGEVHSDGGEGFTRVRTGEAVLMDMSRASRSRLPDAHLVTLSLPRALVEAAAGSTDGLHGRVIGAPEASALARTLASLPISSEASAGGGERGEAAAAVTRALGSALDPERPAAAPAAAAVDDARREFVLRFVAAHIASADLEPARIARAVGLSRATLYRLLEPYGGVARFIQDARLIHLGDRLADPGEARSFCEIALASGFSTESHASRVFLKAYGLRPGEFRSALLLRESANAEPPLTRAVMADWFKTLR